MSPSDQHASDAPRRPGAPARLIIAALAAAPALFFALRKIINFDLWWHLETGRWIVDNGAVPSADPFSFSTPGAAWVPHYWLSDVVFFLGQRAAGLDGLIVLKALIIAAAFGIVCHLMLREGVHPLLAAGLTIFAAAAASFRFLLRPHIFMFLMAALFFWALARRPGGGRPRAYWLVAPMLLWVNLHGSFFLGPLLAGGLLLEAALEQGRLRLGGRGGELAALGRPALLCGLLLLCTLATPLGPALLRWVVELFLGTSMTHALQIEEHRALGWGEHPMVWALMLTTGAALLLAWRRARPLHWLVFVMTSFLALRGGRYAALAALLQAPILGLTLQQLIARLPARWRLRPGARLLIAAGLPALAALTFALSRQVYGPNLAASIFGFGVFEHRFPVAAVRFLQKIKPRGNLYSSYDFSGYLLWHLPGARTFIDGRNLAAQVALQRQIQRMSAAQVDALMRRLDVRGALVDAREGPYVRYFRSRGYPLVYFDDRALIYLRPDAQPPGRAALPAFRLIVPERLDPAVMRAAAAGPTAAQVERELRRAVQLTPGTFKLRLALGSLLEARRARREALEQYLAALRIDARLGFLHHDLGRLAGRLALHAGRHKLAVDLLRQAVALTPRDPELARLLAAARRGRSR